MRYLGGEQQSASGDTVKQGVSADQVQITTTITESFNQKAINNTAGNLQREIKPVGTFVMNSSRNGGEVPSNIARVCHYFTDRDGELSAALIYNTANQKNRIDYIKASSLANFDVVESNSGLAEFANNSIAEYGFKEQIIQLVSELRRERKGQSELPKIPFLRGNTDLRNRLFSEMREQAEIAGGYANLNGPTLKKFVAEFFDRRNKKDLSNAESEITSTVIPAYQRTAAKTDAGYVLFEPKDAIITTIGPDDEPIQVVSPDYIRKRLIELNQINEQDSVENSHVIKWCKSSSLEPLNLRAATQSGSGVNLCNCYTLADVIHALKEYPFRQEGLLVDNQGIVVTNIAGKDEKLAILHPYARANGFDVTNFSSLVNFYGVNFIDGVQARGHGSEKLCKTYRVEDLEKLKFVIRSVGGVNLVRLDKKTEDRAVTLVEYLAQKGIEVGVAAVLENLKTSNIAPIKYSEVIEVTSTSENAELMRKRLFKANSCKVLNLSENKESGTTQRIVVTNTANNLLMQLSDQEPPQAVYWKSDLDNYFDQLKAQ